MNTEMGNESLLRVEGVSKAFPGVQALDKVDFEIKRGEVHFLIGENGAGKSTLINILSGKFPPDEGKIWLGGEQVLFARPIDAQKAGIKTIHQEFMLLPNLDVAENITIGHRPMVMVPIVNWKETYRIAEEILGKLNVKLDLKRKVSTLLASEKQIVDIARALLGEAKLLIMDEPTSALSSGEIQNLFKLVKELRRQGIAIIYISHRLEELSEIGDRVTVFRDGKKVSTHVVDKDLHTDFLVEEMVGTRIEEQYPHTPVTPKEVRLKTEGLCLPGTYNDINIEARRGEIVGITGVIGSGMEPLAHSLAGILNERSGQVFIDGNPVKLKTPIDAIANNIGLIPSDRRDMGVIVDFPVIQNISLPLLEMLGKMGWINMDSEEKVAQEYAKKLNIVTPNLYAATKNLSGGNQQKIVIAKWLAKAAEILVCIEPTRGIDVGAKTEIYALFHQMVEDGKTVLLFSTDYSEVLGMCDRIYVIRDGEIVEEFKHDNVKREQLIAAVFGEVKKSRSGARESEA